MKPYLHKLLAVLGELGTDERQKIMGAVSALSKTTIPKNLLKKCQTELCSKLPELDENGYIFLSDVIYHYVTDDDRYSLAVLDAPLKPESEDVEEDFAEEAVREVQRLLSGYSKHERAKIASAWWIIDWGEGLDDGTIDLYLGNIIHGTKTVSPIRLELQGGGKVFIDLVKNEILGKSWETEEDEE